MQYHCSVCGQCHNDLPDIGSDRPDPWWRVPVGERDRRTVLTTDTCVIDGEEYYIRGVIEIPVLGYSRSFGLGAWVSQQRENFLTYIENPDSEGIGPFFGWLCTRIAYYQEETLLLKTRAHFRSRGLRPAIEIEPTAHPLAVDQRSGISLEKAWQIVHWYEGQRSVRLDP